MPWASALRGDEPASDSPSWITPSSKRAFSQHDEVENDHFRSDNADSLVGRADKKPYSVSREVPAPRPVIGIDNRRHPRLTVGGRKIGNIGQLGDAARDGKVPLSWLTLAVRAEKVQSPSAVQTVTRFTQSTNADGVRRSGPPARTTPALTRNQTQRNDGPFDGRPPKIEGVQRVNRRRDDSAAERKIHGPDSFWRTVVADRGRHGTNAPGLYQRLCEDYFSKASDPGATTRVLDTVSKVRDCIWSRNREVMDRDRLEFLRHVQVTTWNRKFMVTERPNVGLVPPDAIFGDMICLLWGCSVPVILREKPDGQCVLIGECYVHGIMNGEFLDRNSGIETKVDDLNRRFEII